MNVKDIMVIYGGEWVGKGVDKLVNMYLPADAQTVKIAAATVLPLLTLMRLPETAKDLCLLVGGYLATKA